jgi:transporter family-2 protein
MSWWQLGLTALIVQAGLLTPIQLALNGRVRDAFGSPWSAALINFVVGFVVLAAVTAVGRSSGASVKLPALAQLPAWAYLGGACGAFIVSISIIAEKQMGKAAIISALVLGQQLGSLVLDHYGWLGGRQVPFTVARGMGAALVVIGVWILQWQKQ